MSERTNKAIAAALLAAKGNTILAQKALAVAVLEDELLLREFVAPYLKPILAQAIERATRPPRVESPQAAKTLSGAAKAIISDLRAGYNPMKASVAASVAPPSRPTASGRHVSTLKLIAAAYQVKRSERI